MLFSLRYSLNKGKGFHVAVVLLSNGSQNTPKCDKNITDTLACDSCATFFFCFLQHFDVNFDPVSRQTHGKIESIC